MSGVMAVAVDTLREIVPPDGEFGSGVDIHPLDAPFFSRNGDGDRHTGDVVLEDLDFDFSFDDMSMPPADALNDLFNSANPQHHDFLRFPESNFAEFALNFDRLDGVIKSTSPELCDFSGDAGFSADQSWDNSGVLNSASPGMESHQISGYLNMPSPESNGSNRDSTVHCNPDTKGLNHPSPESQGSENFGSDVSESSHNCAGGRLVSSSPNSSNSSIKFGVVDQKIKLEESATNDAPNSLLKRKNESEDIMKGDNELKIVKCRKPSSGAENNNSSSIDVGEAGEDEEKRKVRLMRNRESAQLSRQRKKHYIEELEDKVKNMHSTIQDLNMKISYVMAENATLRQQVGSSSGNAPAAPAPPMAPPPPGMYPHPAMMYPWMPCPPPYMMKSQGSQVPLVPIPRLKPQQPASAPKETKKKNRKSEGAKTKKVAGVSFLGLLFFIMLFGGMVPLFNSRYGEVREALTGGEINSGNNVRGAHHGRVLTANGTEYGGKHGSRRDFSNSSVYCGQESCGNKAEPSADEFVRLGNGSEHLAASLYVPRNDKLVKIDGNLIIHSVLASEKAKASNGKGDGETSVAFRGDLVPAIPTSDAGRSGARPSHLRAGVKSTTDGKLQQWFQEGLAGPMLNAGTCTEVFQFDVSAASGAIIPVPPTRSLSENQNQNSTQLSKTGNRRFLHSIPLPDPSHSISSKRSSTSEKDNNLNGNKNESSMVVSVLFDPRETGDGDVDGVMGTKSLSRIFVVVLIENVRYVTYSCMLPFKGIVSHLVTP